MRRDFELDGYVFPNKNKSEEGLTLTVEGNTAVAIPNPAWLFKADFIRDGQDLILENKDGPDIRIIDYFAAGAPVDLVTSEGGRLAGPLVERLAGPESPGQYAQAGDATAATPIGQVETVQGTATVQRNDGTVEVLNVSMKVYQNDVVSTEGGAKLSLTFVDGTMFTLAEASRMVLDELVYTLEGEDNSAVFSLVEGGFVFVAGQVAKTGEMEVNTPSATMGIRGTTVIVDIATDNGTATVSVSLTEDFDGTGAGVIELRDLNGNLFTTITSVDSKWVVPLGDDAYQVTRTADDDASDSEILADAAAAFAYAYARVEGGQNFVDLNSSTIRGGSSGDFNPGTGEDLGDAVNNGGDTPEDGDEEEELTPDEIDPTKLDSIDGNAAPLINDVFASGAEDNSISGILTGTGDNSDQLEFSIGTPPANGAVALLPDGTYTYIPNPDFNGTDNFTYSVSDGQGGTDTATVSLTVTPVNDAPTLAAGAANATEDGSAVDVDLAVLGDDLDSDDDGSTLTYTVTGAPSEGTATIDGTTLTFDPGENFQYLAAGTTQDLTIEITASDANGGTAVNEVTVTITGVNDAAEIAGDITGDITEDDVPEEDTGTLNTFGSLSVSDPDEGEANFVAQNGSDGAYGSFSIDAAGNWSYAADNNQTAIQELGEGDTLTDSFEVSTAEGTSETITVTITGVNDTAEISVVDFTPVNEGDTGVLSNVVFDPVSVLTATDADAGDTPQIVPGSLSIAASQDSDTTNITHFSIGVATVVLDTANYDFLKAGESGRFILSFDVESGGQVSTNTTLIEITGQNDTPVAESVFIEADNSGDIVGSIPITDPDDSVFSFTFPDGGPSKGTIDTNPDGSFTYTPNTGETGFDNFEVQVADGEDSTTVNVTVALEQDGGTQASAFDLGLGINLETGQDDPAGSARVERSETKINIAFALDISGSFVGEFTQQVNAVESAMDALRTQFENSGTQIDTALITFGAGATSYGTFDLYDDETDIDNALTTIRNGGASDPRTDWHEGIDDAREFFTEPGQGSDEVNIFYFITDGNPSGPDSDWQEAVGLLRDAVDVDIYTFGIGSFNDDLLEEVFTIGGTQYSFDSDRNAVTLTTASDLTAAIQDTPIFTAALVSFELTLASDGLDQGVIADETSGGFEAQGVDFLLRFASIDGIEGLIGDQNDFVATAVFDVDGNLSTTDDQITLVETARLTRPDEAVTLVGNELGDLLVGGAEADSISGEAGNDLLLGGGGQDTLAGGEGDDRLVFEGPLSASEPNDAVADGGGGRDVLVYNASGSLTDDLLPTLTITDIEVIDMENGKINGLALSLADLQSLSSTADAELDALLTSISVGTDSASVLGDPGDSLGLSNSQGDILDTGLNVTDSTGNTLSVYEFQSSIGPVGYLAVDDDINVSGAMPPAA